MLKKVWFYDVEVYPNFFCVTFKCRDTGKVRYFSLYEVKGVGYTYIKSDLFYLDIFIKNEVCGLIGFNCINYDYPILHFILTFSVTNYLLYQKSQEIVNSDFPAVRKPLIPQLDLYKIWHFDNKNKATSLKYVEAGIRFHNVEDLPYEFNKELSIVEILEVASYNLNDVNATEAFYKITIGETDNILYKGDNKIQLRKDIQKEFGINCLNYNDVKIGEEINKKFYLEKSGKKWWDIKNSCTEREWINIKDLIPKHISFKSDVLRGFLEEIRDKSFMPHQDFERIINFAGNNFVIAKGGIHSEDNPGIFECQDNEYIRDIDVGSQYPKTIINQVIYPAHLGPEFLEVYERVYNLRMEVKKTKPSVAAALKLSLNGGGYGKFGSDKSWMKDELAMFKVTFCCQLSILMLIEDLFLNGITILSANTDGVVTRYDKFKHELVNSILSNWEKVNDCVLESTYYKKYIRRDINNYITLKEDGKCKFKGCFEIDKELHKDPSQRIVAIALKEYFINNIPVEDIIINHKDIFDFCCIDKKKGEAKLESWYYDSYGNKYVQKLGKVVRYYVSNKGFQLMKILPPLEKNTITKTEIHRQKVDKNQVNLFDFVEDCQVIKNRETNLKKNQYCTIFNKYQFQEKYDINYEYYINECNKIIKQIIK